MHYRNFNAFLSSGFCISLLVLLVFVVLQHQGIAVGHFMDWVVGVSSFWWLLMVVTVPWNIHFEARGVLIAADASRERGIPVKAAHEQFARTWVNRSLALAIVLHLLSAAGLYAVAASGISVVGYPAAAAALLLTFLRPIARAYEYIAMQLAAIRQEIHYPREDVVQLRHELQELQALVKTHDDALDANEPQSWAAHTRDYAAASRQLAESNRAELNDLRDTNAEEHARLSRQTEHAIAQITADGQFLEHVREIIRFVKGA